MALKYLVFNALIVSILWTASTACPEEDMPSKYSDEAMRKRYETWLNKHGRRYHGREEWELRYGIYHSNVIYIDYINSQNLSYKLIDNKFADMTNDEFRAKYLGFQGWRSQMKQQNISYHRNITNLPENVDWRKEDAVTPVKDQGSCGISLMHTSIT